MERIELSIIVPIFNQEKYLNDCLRSLDKQSFDEYEVLLIDDGSTDNSKGICLEYCDKNPKFKYFYQANKGLGPARNTGLEIANGEYIMFVDADDAILDDSIKNIISYIIENNYDLLYYDELVCDENLLNGHVIASLPTMELSINKELALCNCFNPSHIWSKIYKKELFNHTRFKKIWYEDMEIIISLLDKAEHIGYYKLPIYSYRQHNSSITHNEHDERNLDVIKGWENANEYIMCNNKFRPFVESALRESIFEFIYFKPFFLSDYIKWYNEHLLVKCCTNNEDSAGGIDIFNTQLVNQVRAYELSRDMNLITVLRKNYNSDLWWDCGSFLNYDTEKRGIFIAFDQGKIKVKGMCLERNSKVIRKTFEDMKKDNIVSRQNKIKDGLIDKLLVKNAIMSGCKIYI